ncbi:transcription termination/antitermination factor NusG [Candidatus Wolfebacteria bacterium]|nr:transcription termination/antitermination factor NusG [Candidatus Wolfebacteria bacterium]
MEESNKKVNQEAGSEKPAKSGTRFPEGVKKGERHWYAAHTYAGYEDAVARYLRQRVDTLMMNDKIFNVIVPKEKKIKIKNGKRKVIEEKLYPGYVLVDMVMSEDSWYIVRNTPRVTGFVGADSTEPTPLSKEEVDALMGRMEGEEPKFKIELRIGDAIKIIDGPFKDYDGKVSSVDDEHGKVKVMVPIFGRETAVELDSLQVQRI